ncbi:MAG: hypothetical protein RL685_3591 [Pseudomonadota bacterium]
MSTSVLCERLRRASMVCGAFGTIVGLTAFVGWILGSELLKGSFVAGITMKTNTALCLTLSGLQLVLLGETEGRARWRSKSLARVLAGLVMAIGVGTLAQHAFRIDLGIDELLFREPLGAVATTSPNRMGPVASSCLAALGLGRLLLEVRTRQERAPFQYLAIAVILITSVPLLGFLFDARVLFSIGRFTGIAMPTAAALWVLALGLLLSRPDVGWMRRLIAEDSGALLLRRLLPAAVVLPVLLMLLRIWGQDQGLYEQVVGRALLVISLIVVFTAVVWRTGDVVFRQATLAARAERDLHVQLVQSLDALADADRRKTEFLAMLAHELRNPLAPVRTAVHVLRTRDGAEPTAARTYTVIERQIEHLARLIDDLMDVSRISQDKLELRKERVKLADVISGAVEASRYLIDQHQHELSLSLPPEDVQLDADAARLVQVFTNLLSNAARYTPDGGEISVRAELVVASGGASGEAGNEAMTRDLLVTVADSGMGIAQEQLARVFDMFYQAGENGRHGRHGLGIGLALVRKLVELHGGSVTAYSAGPGQGSKFQVRFPARLVLAAIPPASAETTAVPPQLGNLRVLIVEDNVDSGEMLSELLQLTGAEVHHVVDGESALVTGERLRPQVLLLDIGLPGKSGYDVAREVRASSWGEHVFIVALTGWGSSSDRERTREAGFDRHLVKPVQPDALLELVAEHRRGGDRTGAAASGGAATRESRTLGGSPVE